MSLARLPVRGRAVRHKAYVRAFSGIAPYYLVNEFPKSGGTWLAQMLADAGRFTNCYRTCHGG